MSGKARISAEHVQPRRPFRAPASGALPVRAVAIALPVTLPVPVPLTISVPVSPVAGAVVAPPHGAVVPTTQLVPVSVAATARRLPTVLTDAGAIGGRLMPVAVAARLVTVALGSAVVSTGPTGYRGAGQRCATEHSHTALTCFSRAITSRNHACTAARGNSCIIVWRLLLRQISICSSSQRMHTRSAAVG